MDEFKRVVPTVLDSPGPSGENESPEDFSMIDKAELEQLLTVVPNVTLRNIAFRFGVSDSKMSRFLQWKYKDNFYSIRAGFSGFLKAQVWTKIYKMAVEQENDRCLIYLAEKLSTGEAEKGSSVIPLAYVPLSQREKKIGN